MSRHARQAVLLLLVTIACAPVLWAADRPNILVIFTDDQRADTIAALGNPVIKTPNLDRLVHRGLSFSRAYMQGGFNGATCIPSRAMLLSGRSLFHADETMMKSATWPEAFGKAGYTTFVSGKWHNGAPSLLKEFQIARSMFLGGMTDPMHTSLTTVERGQLVPPVPSPRHACQAFADETIRFLKEHRGGPFLAYLPFDGPHDPHIVPDDFPIRYDPAAMPLPANFLPIHPFDNGEMIVRDELLLPWPRTPDAVRAQLADYYRYVSYLDMLVGQVLDALAASPWAGNTIVVFARRLRGGARQPRAERQAEPLRALDPRTADHRRAGYSPRSAHRGDDLPVRRAADAGRARRRAGAGRQRRARLRRGASRSRAGAAPAAGVRLSERAAGDPRRSLEADRYPRVDVTQLFDLAADPLEKHDLAGDPAHAGMKDRLRARLAAELTRAGDTLALVVPDPQPAAVTAAELNARIAAPAGGRK